MGPTKKTLGAGISCGAKMRYEEKNTESGHVMFMPHSPFSVPSAVVIAAKLDRKLAYAGGSSERLQATQISL